MQGRDADTWIRMSPNETAGDARVARACLRGEKEWLGTRFCPQFLFSIVQE